MTKRERRKKESSQPLILLAQLGKKEGESGKRRQKEKRVREDGEPSLR